jgi:GNAT superfamily N-acetyltransferase
MEPLQRIRLTQEAEAAAGADMYRAAPAQMGLQVRTVAGATLLIAPRIPVTYFNRAIGLGDFETAKEADLDAILDTFRAHAVREYWIHLSPASQPPNLRKWLETRGFAVAQRRSWAKFIRGIEPPPHRPSAIEVRPATPADAQVVARITCAAYGMPDALMPWFSTLVGRPRWHFLLAWLGGQPIACGALYVHDRTGWLGVGATLSEARNRGAQSALLAARITLARSLGCETLVTETGEPVDGEKNPSLDNIRRAGFEQVCSRLNFAAPQTT